MNAVATPLSALATSSSWQKNFLAVLPAVQRHAEVSFRRMHAEARAEAAAHAIAAACVSYHALTIQGKLAHVFAGSVAAYAVKSVRAGRNVGGHINSKDVLNLLAQKRRHIKVRSTSPWNRQDGDWRDVVLESRRATPAEQACFNLDFQEWMRGWSHRDRQIICEMAAGHGTFIIARHFSISPARVSQLRHKFEQSWLSFQGMSDANAAA